MEKGGRRGIEGEKLLSQENTEVVYRREWSKIHVFGAETCKVFT